MAKKNVYFWALMAMNILLLIMIIASAFTENLTCVPIKTSIVNEGNDGKSYEIDSSCNYIKT